MWFWIQIFIYKAHQFIFGAQACLKPLTPSLSSFKMQDLSLAIIQFPIQWEDPQKTKIMVDQMLEGYHDTVDLILLPEMFTTGFTMNHEACAETMNGPTVRWMQRISAERSALLMGSLIIRDQDKVFNRAVCCFPEGTVKYYDKRHLFTLASEDKFYQRGISRLVFEFRHWKIMPYICYDLRFPVWLRNTEGIDLMIGMAQFPKKRRQAWNVLSSARAIENVCYLAGANGLGYDGNGIEYSGDSGVWDYEGTKVLDMHDQAQISGYLLSKDKLRAFRKTYPFLSDQDDFRVS